MTFHRSLAHVLCAAALLGACAGVAAQDYPVKPLRFIAPNLPGGPTDILARLLGQKLSESLGQPVIVENRAGAGGNIGTEVAAKAPPDGYTLVTGNNATFGANVSLYKRLGFDPLKDFTPIVFVATQPNILVVHPALPVRNVKELIALARARPGELNYAGSGVGAAAHLAAELFKNLTGTKIEHISYKSAGPGADGSHRGSDAAHVRHRALGHARTSNRTGCGRLQSRRTREAVCIPNCPRSRRQACPDSRRARGMASW